MEEPAENSLDNRPQGDPEAPWPRPGHRFSDERCSPAVLDFRATDVGRTSGPTVAVDEDCAASEASDWDAREQAERAAERLAEDEWLGAA